MRRRLLDRRWFLQALGIASARIGLDVLGNQGSGGSVLAWAAESEENSLLSGRPLVRYPEKTDLILLTSRPPQLETPMRYFEQAITPNEAFYVRYHITPPTQIDASTWRLKIGGHVEQPLELSLQDLQSKFARATIVAVNQCSGNGRGYSSPRVFGGQWGNGAMGNAEWRGVRLRDVLTMAGVKPGAVEATFKGLDRPAVPTIPDFVKSLGVSRIMEDADILIADEMNGKPLPVLNGFPARLIVPGWYATYWVKNLSDINVLDREFDGFWMKKAYLIPDTPCGCVDPATTPARQVPINRMNVRSLIASPENHARLAVGRKVMVKGIAFDGGYGIEEVMVSADGGVNWSRAQLGRDLGKYSFREWSFAWTPSRAGNYGLLARATNRIGESQPAQPLWNPAGYLRHTVERVDVTVA